MSSSRTLSVFATAITASAAFHPLIALTAARPPCDCRKSNPKIKCLVQVKQVEGRGGHGLHQTVCSGFTPSAPRPRGPWKEQARAAWACVRACVPKGEQKRTGDANEGANCFQWILKWKPSGPPGGQGPAVCWRNIDDCSGNKGKMTPAM